MTAQQIVQAPPAIDPGRAHLYDENGVFYPEPDGEPMPDAEYQDRNIRSARYQLDGFYHDRPGTYVSGNTVIYYEQGNPRRNVSPDCYVAFNVDYSVINYHGSYWVWEMGKPPDFVLEVASESTAGNDTGRKMLIYASMGAGEYWLFDRTVNGKHYGFRMAGYYLGPEGYEPFAIMEDAAGNLRAHSPTLGLDICWEYDPALRHGIIRFYNPVSGEYLLDYEESFDALEEARSGRAAAEAALQDTEVALRDTESALQDAEAARTTAEAGRIAAEAEAAALREQLRRLQAASPDDQTC